MKENQALRCQNEDLCIISNRSVKLLKQIKEPRAERQDLILTSIEALLQKEN